MSLWDALSGTIYHWTRLKEQSNRRLFHRLRGFDLRNIGLPKEALEGLTPDQQKGLETYFRGRALAFIGSTQQVLDVFFLGDPPPMRGHAGAWGQTEFQVNLKLGLTPRRTLRRRNG